MELHLLFRPGPREIHEEFTTKQRDTNARPLRLKVMRHVHQGGALLCGRRQSGVDRLEACRCGQSTGLAMLVYKLKN